MQLVVKKTSRMSGEVHIPASKSQSIRGMFFALLAKGHSVLLNALDSDDTRDAISICQAFGAEVTLQQGKLTLISKGAPYIDVINRPEVYTGNSGISTRFLLPLLGLRANHMTPVLINCGEQMRTRPIQSLLDALCCLGMQVQYLERKGQLPIRVSGQLKGGEVEIDGTTSQYLSALLISLPCAQQDSVIRVRQLNERPYVEMTLAWLTEQRIQYEHQQKEGIDIFKIKGGQCYQPFQKTIPGDFSSASCLLAAGCLVPGEITLQGLDMNDTQGDKQLISILQKMGAHITSDEKKISLKGGKTLQAISIDANTIPDLLPALAVIATQATGKTEIRNVKQARIKETDRIHSMTEGLRRMGATIEEHADGMTIYPSCLHGAYVEGYGDHRTVMALTIAGLLAEGETVITDGESITKTYPEFIETMQSLGARIRFIQEFCTPTSRGLSAGSSILSTSLDPADKPRDVELDIKPKNPLKCETRVPQKLISDKKHIMLMGFKHVGKTAIGKQLAAVLQKQFIDLDDEIEKHYKNEHAKSLSCRQIMQLHGESYYRKQEQVVLENVLSSPSSVIALGGGVPLNERNQIKIKLHILLHIVAPRGIVFERIMVSGRPAFFNPEEEPYVAFNRLWEERRVIYEKLAACTVNNHLSINDAVTQAILYLENRIEQYEHHQ